MGETALPDLSYAPSYYDAPTTPTTPAPCDDAPATTPTPYDAPATTTTTPAPPDAPAATTPSTTTPSSAHIAHNVPTALQVVAEGRQASRYLKFWCRGCVRVVELFHDTSRLTILIRECSE